MFVFTIHFNWRITRPLYLVLTWTTVLKKFQYVGFTSATVILVFFLNELSWRAGSSINWLIHKKPVLKCWCPFLVNLISYWPALCTPQTSLCCLVIHRFVVQDSISTNTSQEWKVCATENLQESNIFVILCLKLPSVCLFNWSLQFWPVETQFEV